MDESTIRKIKRTIKKNILYNSEFIGHEKVFDGVLDLLYRTIKHAESNSALLIGPRGCGKTTLVNSVLNKLDDQDCFSSDALLVKLHGLVHTDDRLALKSITYQMNLENVADGKVFGSFAENLAFLLASLKSGNKEISKSVIFILDEFDLFCSHHNQTLLYNLFDVSQSAQAPICVLGMTCRLDVIELLEKRVKSRFSHRQIFLFPGEDETSHLEHGLNRIEYFLKLPDGKQSGLKPASVKQWNKHISSLRNDKKFQNLMQRLFDIDLSEVVLKSILVSANNIHKIVTVSNYKEKERGKVELVSQLSEENPQITYNMFEEQLQKFEQDDVVQTLQDLSVLELSLIIAMKHHCEIYDNQPLNFEMILTRYTKFINANSNIQAVPRPVIMKAFEHIQKLELIAPVSTSIAKVQKEYKLFTLLVTPEQLLEAMNKSTSLPTEIIQWANSSLV